ncbi:MAG: hypothetical protein ACR2P6_08980 [Gammaproteobacteria bacterium]
MRITDDRYAGELHKFELAMRMITHEARTGTIRACTGFSEDRIRKIYSTYFKFPAGTTVKRRRGKSPSQITGFVSSSWHQAETTVVVCLFFYCGVTSLGPGKGPASAIRQSPEELGKRLCCAYEIYCQLYAEPHFSFEKIWALYKALVQSQELYLAKCAGCGAPYVQDAYALDYERCPFCELKDQGNHV